MMGINMGLKIGSIEENNLLRENMENAIKRYRKRYEGGHCTYEEYVRLVEWEKKNYESGGVLYADKLAKALTPNFKWKW
jgi:hypothetical protein